MKKLAAAFAVFLLLIIGLWHIAIPQGLIVNLIENSISSENIYLKTDRLEKGFFFNVSAEKILLNKKPSSLQLLSFSDINAGLSLKSLLKMNPAIAFDCLLNGGTVSGEASFRDRGITISGSNISIKEIPFFELIGIRGGGHLTGILWHSNGKGEIKFTVPDLRLESSSLGTAFLPLNLFNEMRGVLTINGKTIEVQSFILQGLGVSARLKGTAQGNHIDMKLEVMMDSSYTPSLMLQMMLKAYKVSPGYCVIPIKTSLFF